jgi:hypothetical protein
MTRLPQSLTIGDTVEGNRFGADRVLAVIIVISFRCAIHA